MGWAGTFKVAGVTGAGAPGAPGREVEPPGAPYVPSAPVAAARESASHGFRVAQSLGGRGAPLGGGTGQQGEAHPRVAPPTALRAQAGDLAGLEKRGIAPPRPPSKGGKRGGVKGPGTRPPEVASELATRGGGFEGVGAGDGRITAFFQGHKVKKGTTATYRPEFQHYRDWIAYTFKSEDVYLESAPDDETRARVWVQYGIHLFMYRGLREREIGAALGAVRHHFDVALKSTEFLGSTLVKTLNRSTARTTAEKRKHAMVRAEHAIYPLCDEIEVELRERLWEGTSWEDFEGAYQKMAYAAILLAIRRGFRVSNYVRVQPGGEDHCIRATDVTFDVDTGEEDGSHMQVLATVMQGVEAGRVRGFTTKVYTTKTGESAPTLVSQYTGRGAGEDSHLVDVLTECVQRSGVKDGDELFTIYRKCARAGSKKLPQRETRKVLQRKDVAGFIKDGSEAVGLTRKNFSTHSLRKTHATQTAPGGGGSVLTGDLNWAEPGGGRVNSTRAAVYDYSAATGKRTRGSGVSLTKDQLVSILPVRKR